MCQLLESKCLSDKVVSDHDSLLCLSTTDNCISTFLCPQQTFNFKHTHTNSTSTRQRVNMSTNSLSSDARPWIEVCHKSLRSKVTSEIPQVSSNSKVNRNQTHTDNISPLMQSVSLSSTASQYSILQRRQRRQRRRQQQQQQQQTRNVNSNTNIEATESTSSSTEAHAKTQATTESDVTQIIPISEPLYFCSPVVLSVSTTVASQPETESLSNSNNLSNTNNTMCEAESSTKQLTKHNNNEQEMGCQPIIQIFDSSVASSSSSQRLVFNMKEIDLQPNEHEEVNQQGNNSRTFSDKTSNDENNNNTNTNTEAPTLQRVEDAAVYDSYQRRTAQIRQIWSLMCSLVYLQGLQDANGHTWPSVGCENEQLFDSLASQLQTWTQEKQKRTIQGFEVRVSAPGTKSGCLCTAYAQRCAICWRIIYELDDFVWQ